VSVFWRQIPQRLLHDSALEVPKVTFWAQPIVLLGFTRALQAIAAAVIANMCILEPKGLRLFACSDDASGNPYQTEGYLRFSLWEPSQHLRLGSTKTISLDRGGNQTGHHAVAPNSRFTSGRSR